MEIVNTPPKKASGEGEKRVEVEGGKIVARDGEESGGKGGKE